MLISNVTKKLDLKLRIVVNNGEEIVGWKKGRKISNEKLGFLYST
jgi:hypothetical protein